MKKGIDYTGVTVTFFCHDGQGNYLFHKRGALCRDEHGRWDCGGGGLQAHERLLDGVRREVQEEYAAEPQEIEFLGYSEVFREHEGVQTHWIAFRYRVLVDRAEVVNNEPEKHEDINWFTLESLPTPLHSQIPDEIEQYKEFLK